MLESEKVIMATRIEQLADAFLVVATVYHYMVGIVEPYTSDELDGAEQLLITRSNEQDNENPDLELALDLIEHARLIGNFLPACEHCGSTEGQYVPPGSGDAVCLHCGE